VISDMSQWLSEYPGAWVSSKASLGENVAIGIGSIVYDNVCVGDNTSIEEHCVIGKFSQLTNGPLVIGAGSIIRSHTVVYQDSILAERLETGHHVVIRERTNAGINLRVGNFSDIEGNCSIGDYCRCHSYVHIGKGSKLGHFIWLYSLTTLTNDPLPPSRLHCPVEIQDGAVVCVGSTVLPGAILGRGCFITAGARVSGTIQDGAVITSDNCVAGHVSNLMHMETATRHPWMNHFMQVYPECCHDRLRQLSADIMSTKKKIRAAHQEWRKTTPALPREGKENPQ